MEMTAEPKPETGELGETGESPAPPLPCDELAHNVRRIPDAVAVVDGPDHWSYAALGRHASRLARWLVARGVGPEVCVPIHMERTYGGVMATVGTAWAGGAFVPLDPAFPAERLLGMMEDCRAEILLAESALPAELAAGVSERGIRVETPFIDPEPAEGNGGAGEIGPVEIDPASRAYVIYTSGSTGRPKGVEVPHAALANFSRWHREWFDVRPGDRAAHLAGVVFDATVWEIWPALAAGCAVYSPPEDVRRDIGRLHRWMLECGITHSFLSTPLGEMALGLDWPAGSALRELYIGGDRLRIFPPPGLPFRLTNNYGPTENTILTTSGDIPLAGSPEAEALGLPTLGFPLTNVEVLVLDRALRPLPDGEEGELGLAGANLSRGYLGRPGLTAASFVPHPASPRPGARMYRSGDLGRRLPGGELEFLGRIDHQVQVRGIRIELGEVESALAALEEVEGAVVTAGLVENGRWRRMTGGNTQQLTAYVVPKDGVLKEEEAGAGGTEPDALREALRAALGRRLSEAMVPSFFVFLDALPLTRNGKVDRARLPEPEIERETVAPRTPLEATLAGIVADLLGWERVGVTDGFFDLGMHSLAATRLLWRLREELGVDLGAEEVFRAGSVAGLAAVVEGRGEGSEGRGSERRGWMPIRPADRGADYWTGARGLLPASHIQEHIWLMDSMEGGEAMHNVSAWLRLRGRPRVSALARALSEILRRHEVLRTALTAEGAEGVRQRIHPPGRLPLPMVDLAALPREARAAHGEALARREGRRAFRLSAPPMLRAVLFRHGGPETAEGEVPGTGREEHWLQLSFHHAAIDGWSVGRLIEELSALYGAFVAGEPSPLPEPALQYADYAVWQREHLRGGALEEGLAFWRAELGDAPRLLDLPTDRPRRRRTPAHADARPIRVSAVELRRWKALARGSGGGSGGGAGATLFMTLLAGWMVLLARHAGVDDLVVISPVAGREHAELESMLGLFMNPLALRGRLRDDAGAALPFRDLLGRMRRTALAAYDHQDIPFHKILEHLSIVPTESLTPLSQVAMALQNAHSTEVRLPELEVEVVPIDAAALGYELVLSVAEEGAGEEAELVGTLAYRTALFDAVTMDRWIERWRRLLGAAAARPELPWTALPLLSLEERAQLSDGRVAVGPRLIGLGGRRPVPPALVEAGDRLTLDGEAGEPLPLGVVGELHVRSGEGAAAEPTGFLARRLPDGRVEVLGTTEAEATAAGFLLRLWRIEAEVEALMESRGEGALAAAVLRGGGASLRPAVFYCFSRGEGAAAPRAEDLSAALYEALPAYLLPFRIVPVGELPRVAAGPLRGTVDRGALPELAGEPAAAAPEGREHLQERIGSRQQQLRERKAGMSADKKAFLAQLLKKKKPVGS